MGIAVRNMGLQPSLGWIGLLLLHLLTTILILLSLSYLFSSVAFYAPVQAEEISTHVLDSTGILSTYPLSGMGLAIQLPLITVIPAGLLGWFPALALLGKPPLGFPAFYPMLVAVILYIMAYAAFTKGLKYYVKTGTNRYSAVGHRR
jgi:ABC-2 type transport system permease protein